VTDGSARGVSGEGAPRTDDAVGDRGPAGPATGRDGGRRLPWVALLLVGLAGCCAAIAFIVRLSFARDHTTRELWLRVHLRIVDAGTNEAVAEARVLLLRSEGFLSNPSLLQELIDGTAMILRMRGRRSMDDPADLRQSALGIADEGGEVAVTLCPLVEAERTLLMRLLGDEGEPAPVDGLGVVVIQADGYREIRMLHPFGPWVRCEGKSEDARVYMLDLGKVQLQRHGSVSEPKGR
jgi:hypothetical protein